jgi:nucleotide-binding universal stress UspA family protein
MKDWIAAKPDIVDSICTIGSVDNSILHYSESNEIDLIVMGTEGLFRKSLWSKGSHTEYITNHSEIPVLSLKRDRSNINFKGIVLASDFLECEKFDLSILKDIQKAYDSKMLLLKINTPRQHRTYEQVMADMEAFAVINDLQNYSKYIYTDSSVESGLGKFSAEHDIDLIALGTHLGYGFSKLFSGSISDDVVNHLIHPILTFPLK